MAKAKNKIHIKPENHGKFTKYCGGKVTQECINRGKNSPNPTTRKRAVFAENARSWGAYGGLVNPLSEQYFAGGLILGAGKAIMGGISSLIQKKKMEEQQEKMREAYEEQKMHAERNAMQANLNSIQASGGITNVANPYMMALGGVANTEVNPQDNINQYNTGGTHMENPYGGIQIGQKEAGKGLKTVEEGEVSIDFEDGKYVFSNRLIV